MTLVLVDCTLVFSLFAEHLSNQKAGCHPQFYLAHVSRYYN